MAVTNRLSGRASVWCATGLTVCLGVGPSALMAQAAHTSSGTPAKSTGTAANYYLASASSPARSSTANGGSAQTGWFSGSSQPNYYSAPATPTANYYKTEAAKPAVAKAAVSDTAPARSRASKPTVRQTDNAPQYQQAVARAAQPAATPATQFTYTANYQSYPVASSGWSQPVSPAYHQTQPTQQPGVFSGFRRMFSGQQAQPDPQACGPAVVGTASWYGKDFHGGPTASGERYDMYSMTAAHKTLPFGTVVKVTNLDNGNDCMVKINNRGPYVGNRMLDLSKGAAYQLGILNRGLAKVKMEVMNLGGNGH